jgi:hypothetical protein
VLKLSSFNFILDSNTILHHKQQSGIVLELRGIHLEYSFKAGIELESKHIEKSKLLF